MNRQKLYLVLLLIPLGWVLIYPTSWWSWAVAVIPVAWFGYVVANTSRKWLEALDSTVDALDGSAVPAALEPTMLELSKLGMSYTAAFSSREAGVLMVGREGDSVATLGAGLGGDVVLTTNWPDGRLQTARAAGVPLAPEEYVQHIPGAGLESQLTAHRAGVVTLIRGLGEPRHASGTVDALSDAMQRRRSAFRRRRYRQTARALLLNAVGWYQRPVDWQLGLQTRSGVIWAMVAALGAIIGYTWWWATERATARAAVLAFSSTLLYGGLLALVLAAMRVRRRFL